MAESLGLGDRVTAMIEDIIKRTPRAIDALSKRLPEDFPTELFESVASGMTAAVERLARELDRRSARSVGKR
jgi:serine/threonine-protein kinase HipA